jgi:hypothetical protein
MAPLTFSEDELRLLRSILSSERQNARMEVRHTDNLEFMNELQDRLHQLNRVLTKVERAADSRVETA